MVRGLDKDWNLISRYGREIIPVLAEQWIETGLISSKSSALVRAYHYSNLSETYIINNPPSNNSEMTWQHIHDKVKGGLVLDNAFPILWQNITYVFICVLCNWCARNSEKIMEVIYPFICMFYLHNCSWGFDEILSLDFTLKVIKWI